MGPGDSGVPRARSGASDGPRGGGRSTSRGRGRQTRGGGKETRPTVAAAVITVIGLFIVAFLGLQASHSASSATAAGSSASGQPTSPATAPKTPVIPPVPAGTGSGQRIVYSLGQRRVWLTGKDGSLLATFTVMPGFESPTVGKVYVVQFHQRRGAGNDGQLYQYGTFFGVTSDGLSLAFDTIDMTTATETPTAGPFEPEAAVDITGKTAAIRVSLDAANILYHNSTSGTTRVWVLP